MLCIRSELWCVAGVVLWPEGEYRYAGLHIYLSNVVCRCYCLLTATSSVIPVLVVIPAVHLPSGVCQCKAVELSSSVMLSIHELHMAYPSFPPPPFPSSPSSPFPPTKPLPPLPIPLTERQMPLISLNRALLCTSASQCKRRYGGPTTGMTLQLGHTSCGTRPPPPGPWNATCSFMTHCLRTNRAMLRSVSEGRVSLQVSGCVFPTQWVCLT